MLKNYRRWSGEASCRHAGQTRIRPKNRVWLGVEKKCWGSLFLILLIREKYRYKHSNSWLTTKS
jgi:hypothetical protein